MVMERSGMVLSGTVAVWFRNVESRNGKVRSGFVMARQGSEGIVRSSDAWNGDGVVYGG